MRKILLAASCTAALGLAVVASNPGILDASSHREAPLISYDPQADNTDLYAFRSPDNPNTVTIIANYIPLEHPDGGPNYYSFGENVRYEIHIKNKTSMGALGTAKDDITYRFTFNKVNEDSTTFFNIRLGKQNQKTTYTMEKSMDGGATFTTMMTNGIVPPNNIGPRSIEGAAGLNTTYDALVQSAIMNTQSGEKVFCGPRDDAFFVDLGGIFDLGGVRNQFGNDVTNAAIARDGVAGYNTHSIVMQIPIQMLQKDGKTVDQAANILDGDFVIGVWASASRQQIKTLSTTGGKPTYSGDWVQVSRLGMPLTNEVVIPIGMKDAFNAITPYSALEQTAIQYTVNPELALYMDDSKFGGAVPGLAPLRIQSQSYPALGTIPGYTTPGLDFRNGKDGAFAVTKLSPPPNLAGTAFAAPISGGLVAEGQPRRVDLYPIFFFGVPNLIPYQLATGKTGGPLSAGKPFINNFLPVTNDGTTLYGGDMLRLNMATPVTTRGTDEYTKFARLGLIRAAAIGLTAAPFNTNTNIESMPHMDGFPNGRRLEDDVVSIGLQAVGGLVLAAVGLPFDDAVAGNYSDLASPKLLAELNFVAGPTKNDMMNLAAFPYMPTPHRGYDFVRKMTADAPTLISAPNSVEDEEVGLIGKAPIGVILDGFANPVNATTEINYVVTTNDIVRLRVFDATGREVASLVNARKTPGKHSAQWDASAMTSGTYYLQLQVGQTALPAKKLVVAK